MKKVNQGYRKLQIYLQAHQLAIDIHAASLQLPAFERYEEGSQLRRSSKSVVANIVEGYALRKYKKEFVHFLFRAYASCEETLEHLELLFETHSLTDQFLFNNLRVSTNNLCGKILRYIQAVDRDFDTPSFMKEQEMKSLVDQDTERSKSLTQTPNPEPRTPYARDSH